MTGQSRRICRGRKPFGFRDEETVVIAKMRDLRAKGLGFDRIADALNRDRVPSRDGKDWHGLVVNRILARSRSAINDS